MPHYYFISGVPFAHRTLVHTFPEIEKSATPIGVALPDEALFCFVVDYQTALSGSDGKLSTITESGLIPQGLDMLLNRSYGHEQFFRNRSIGFAGYYQS